MPGKIKPKLSKNKTSQKTATKKPGGVNLEGNNIDIAQDVVGGDKIVNFNNYYQAPPGNDQTRFSVFKQFIIKLIQNRWTWAVLFVILLSIGGLYWKQQNPLSVCPPANGNYIVLISKFEPIDTAERDVSRFISDDLKQKLSIQPAPTNFIICEYPRVIQTDEEALEIAQLNHANIIVWGNYTSDFIEAQVQTGETSDLLIAQDILGRTANVRVRMNNERLDSLARQVVALLDIITLAKGDSYEAFRNSVKLYSLDPTNSVIISEGVPGYVYEQVEAFTDNTTQALEKDNAAIELDAGNPLLYIIRAVTLQRLGRFDEAFDDLETATRLGPPGWTTPMIFKAQNSMISGNYDDALQYFDRAIEIGPDHWFQYNMRGYIWLTKGNLDLAKADIDKSIELKPTENWPYMWATAVALRQGRFADAKNYIEEGLKQFPDPDAGNKVTELIAAENANPFTPALSAFWSMNLGQFNKAIQNSEVTLKINPYFTDAYLVEGISYCNLGKLPEAEAALSKAIEIEPTLIAAYLLRAGVRVGLSNTMDALADFSVVQQSPIASEMHDYILAAQAGTLNCKNFLTFTP